MDASQNQSRNWNVFRWVALAAGLWLVGSGVWGLLTTTPEDRAVTGCEAAARTKAEDPTATATHTTTREQQTGWFVAGEVREARDDEVVVVYQWECVTNTQGETPELTTWTPIA